MPRNFYRRVEAVFPVDDTDLRREIMDTLRIYLKDSAQAKQLRPNGSYAKVPVRRKSGPVSAQSMLLDQAAERRAAAEQEREEALKADLETASSLRAFIPELPAS